MEALLLLVRRALFTAGGGALLVAAACEPLLQLIASAEAQTSAPDEATKTPQPSGRLIEAETRGRGLRLGQCAGDHRRICVDDLPSLRTFPRNDLPGVET